MTNAELTKILLEAKDQEWFKTASVKIPFSVEPQDITGVSAIYAFVNQQIDGWEQYGNLPNELEQCKTYLVSIRNAIDSFVKAYYQHNANTLNQQWQNAVVNLITNVSQKYLPYETSEVVFLVKVYQETPNFFHGAYQFLLKTGKYSLNSPEYFYGAVLAYGFTIKDPAIIATRIDSERESISKLKTDFQKYLSQSEQELNQHFYKANSSYADYVKKIDMLKTEKENLFASWFETTKNEQWQNWFDNTKNEQWLNFFDPAVKKIADLEETYKEKLKLEEPAKYWNKRAQCLNMQGWITFAIIIIFVGLICWTLGEILCKTPETIYASWFANDKSAAIKWAIVYATLISFMAFVIRALSKFMFSSFHLARDCEERHTLTYFYLALLKDSEIKDSERQLIMQSLFSRADTGLLKEDSAPTMPNDLIKAIK